MTIEELAKQDQGMMPEDAPPAEGGAIPAQPAPRFALDFGFLKTETGPGPIEDYMDHPLNFNESRGMAQIIRGVTGFTDTINLAIIDIAMGILRMRSGPKAIPSPLRRSTVNGGD